jgi:hypothetical protein
MNLSSGLEENTVTLLMSTRRGFLNQPLQCIVLTADPDRQPVAHVTDARWESSSGHATIPVDRQGLRNQQHWLNPAAVFATLTNALRDTHSKRIVAKIIYCKNNELYYFTHRRSWAAPTQGNQT